MKITKERLKTIIKEELKNTMQEGWWPFGKKGKEEAAPEPTEPEAAVGAVPEGLSAAGAWVYEDEDPERAYAMYQGQLEGLNLNRSIRNPVWWQRRAGSREAFEAAKKADYDPQYKLNLSTEGRGPELGRAYDAAVESIEISGQQERRGDMEQKAIYRKAGMDRSMYRESRKSRKSNKK